VYKDLLYMFGGWDGTNTLNDFWKFNPSVKKYFILRKNGIYVLDGV